MFSSRAYRRCNVLYSSVRGGGYCMLCADPVGWLSAPKHKMSVCYEY